MKILKLLFLPNSTKFYFQGSGILRYEGTNLYVADPKYHDVPYATEDILLEIDLDSTAGKIVQRSNDLFPPVQRPLVVLKTHYVT